MFLRCRCHVIVYFCALYLHFSIFAHTNYSMTNSNLYIFAYLIVSASVFPNVEWWNLLDIICTVGLHSTKSSSRSLNWILNTWVQKNFAYEKISMTFEAIHKMWEDECYAKSSTDDGIVLFKNRITLFWCFIIIIIWWDSLKLGFAWCELLCFNHIFTHLSLCFFN